MAADNSMKPFGGLQDTFLNSLRKEKIPVTVHVVNGYQLNHLLIISFDSYAILAEAGGKADAALQACNLYDHSGTCNRY